MRTQLLARHVPAREALDGQCRRGFALLCALCGHLLQPGAVDLRHQRVPFAQQLKIGARLALRTHSSIPALEPNDGGGEGRIDARRNRRRCRRTCWRFGAAAHELLLLLLPPLSRLLVGE